MASRRYQISIGILLASIAAILICFLYAAYIDFFSPPFVSAAATSGLVLVTAVSVILTISLLNEERKARKQEIVPVFKLGMKGMAIGQRGIVARNIGNGPAQNINVNIDVQPQDVQASISYPNVASGEIIPIGDPFDGDIDYDDVEKITMSGECEDVIGDNHTIDDETQTLEKSSQEYLLTRDREQKYLRDVAKELRNIRRELKN